MKNIPGVQKRGENSYFFTVSGGKGSNNRYIRRTKTYKVEQKFTPKKLEEHLRQEYFKFKEEVLSGEFIQPEKMTFEAFTEQWKNKYLYNLSETTISARLSVLNNHILPELRYRQIDQIRTLLLVDLISGLKSEKNGKEVPASAYTKESVYKTLKSIFKYAKQWRVIKTDPMDGVDKPGIEKKSKDTLNVYDEKEVSLLLEKAQDEPFLWRMFITLALSCGLRRGELLGLEWDSIDFEQGEIDIKQSIVRGRSGAHVKTPKTDSFRKVSLPPSVIEELKRYRNHWEDERDKLRDKWVENNREWLFCNTDGKHLYPTTPTTWWGRFTERAKVRHIRLHDLRHTSATLLIAQGVHAKIISERLGHSRINITMDTYGHALRTADKTAADKLDSFFSNKDN